MTSASSFISCLQNRSQFPTRLTVYYHQIKTDRYSYKAKTKLNWLVLYLAELAMFVKMREPRHHFIAIYGIPKNAEVNPGHSSQL